MKRLWVREREKWLARKRCGRKTCPACTVFWVFYGACAGSTGANSYFAMNHRWTDLHREHGIRLVAQKAI